MTKFATEEYIPVIPNANVSGNAVSGAIDVITVSTRGSNYDTYFSNTFNAIDLRIGGNTVLYGLASGASSNDNFYTDSYLYIKSGTGVGQIRKIVDYIVTDAGNTEFNGIQTKTAVAIGPWDDSEIDKITASLKLL